ncbi:hypothetical protein OC845_005359, partial [Tilletia horrida]
MSKVGSASHRSEKGSVTVSFNRDGTPNTIGTAGEDPLSILRFFDVVLVVDDSSSMHVNEENPDGSSRWDEARRALEGVSRTIARYDSDGIDCVFLNSEKEGRGLRSPNDVKELFNSVDPNGQTPTGERLAMLFLEYWDVLDTWADKKKAGKITAKDVPPKKRNYIVLTDGRASDDVASVIVDCARRLDEGNYPLSQLNIQFIQVGADSEATRALHELDNELEEVFQVRDIVDILAYTGGTLDASSIMKQLYGGIEKRSKGIQEEAAHVLEQVKDTPAVEAVVAKGIVTEEEVKAADEPVEAEEEEQAETIPITADTIPASHPAAEALRESAPENAQHIAAEAAETVGLGTTVGAGLAELSAASESAATAEGHVPESHAPAADDAAPLTSQRSVPTDSTSQPPSDEATQIASSTDEAETPSANMIQAGATSEAGEDEAVLTTALANVKLEEGADGIPPSSSTDETKDTNEAPTTQPEEGVASSAETALDQPSPRELAVPSKVFSLLGKNLKLDTAEDAEPYCQQLAAVEGLEEIHLSGNTLGQGACEAFARALAASRHTLRIFNGADIFTGRLITEIPASLRALCDALVDHSALETVDLSDNAFGGRCADAMSNLFSKNHSIEVIRLQNN